MAVRKREGSPYWQYDFTSGGRRFRGSTGKKTRREALGQERRIRGGIEAGEADSDWTLGQATGTYWEHHAACLPSAYNIEYQIENLLAGLGKSKPMFRLSNADITKYISMRRGQVSNSSVNRELTLLRAILTYAKDAWDQSIPRIRWKRHRLKEPPGRDRFLTTAEYQSLIDNAHEKLKPIIIFAVSTGLRKSNILHLAWSQVDMEARLVRVMLKGNRRHVVEIEGAALAMLGAMKKQEGDVFERTNFRRRWRNAVSDAKLSDLRFHDLRHTFASWARMNGADLVDIKDALGHSDIGMTVRYAHIKRGTIKSAFGLVAAHLAAQSRPKSLKEKKT